MPAVIQPEGALSVADNKRFTHLEATITENLKGFMNVGLALLEISRSKLYRDDYDTWDEYLSERWEFGKSHGSYMIEAAKVSTNIGQLASGYPLPTAPSQVRGMGELTPEEQVAIWKEACGFTAAGEAPTARMVKEAIAAHFARQPASVTKRGRAMKSAAQSADEKEVKKPNNEWYTPEKYIDAVTDVLGRIYLDPASCAEAQETVKAADYFTAAQDGLVQDWTAPTIFLNPPYQAGLVGQFVAKLLKAYADEQVGEAILLVNAQTGSPWFKPLYGQVMCVVDHRINFRRPAAADVDDDDELDDREQQDEDALEKPKKLSQNGFLYSVFVYLGEDVQAFSDYFKQFGPVGRFERMDLDSAPDITVMQVKSVYDVGSDSN